MPPLPYQHILVIVGSLILVAGSALYIRDTLEGKTKPNRVSYTMWGLTPLIGAGAALDANADPWVTVPVLLSGILPILILGASFLSPKSYWKLTFFDYVCGALSILALIVWLIVDHPRIALLLTVFGDGFASYPTIRKAWERPDTETGIAYIAALTCIVLTLPAIPEWTLENTVFQIYLLFMNSALVFSIYRKRIF